MTQTAFLQRRLFHVVLANHRRRQQWRRLNVLFANDSDGLTALGRQGRCRFFARDGWRRDASRMSGAEGPAFASTRHDAVQRFWAFRQRRRRRRRQRRACVQVRLAEKVEKAKGDIKYARAKEKEAEVGMSKRGYIKFKEDPSQDKPKQNYAAHALHNSIHVWLTGPIRLSISFW